MWNVILISQQKLERVFAGRQADLGFGLTNAEMKMVEVVRDRRIERRQLGVDQQVMVSGIRPIDARRGQSHSAQTEMDDGLGRNRLAALDVDEINHRARG